ncbi:MAG: aldehyde dehydrogenase family protein [Peptoniphilaceae bacterium]
MKVNIQEKYKLFINGEWTNPSKDEWIKVINPATGEELSLIANASSDDVDLAVKSAREAFENGWKNTSTEERAKILLKIAQVIEDNAEYLSTIETIDNGKPIRETSNIDIPYAADHFRYFASAIRSEEGSSKILEGRYLSLILKEPLGVVGQIVPWNFPFLMAAWKLAPAIAAGDTIVLKPSSSTSLSVLELAKLIEDILPKGVLNIVTGKGSQAGEYLQNHSGIDKLAFTGSTEVGRNIGIAAAKNLIPATLELGGKSANIVFDDADMDKAIDGALLGILFNQGQVCSAGSRLFVQEGIYENFLERLKKAFENIKVGDPLDPETQMGSQINKGQLDKILNYVEIAKKDGGTILSGGNTLTENGLDKGSFMEPTIVLEDDNSKQICQEEVFGPLVVVQKFKDADEVIKLANDSIYGLGGAVFSSNIKTALKVSRSVRTGRMWVNTYNQIPAGAPFGGYKKSGIGRETHKMILDAYSQTKNIFIDLSEDVSGFYEV